MVRPLMKVDVDASDLIAPRSVCTMTSTVGQRLNEKARGCVLVEDFIYTQETPQKPIEHLTHRINLM